MAGKIELSEEAKRARADYIKNWRKKNPDKVKQYQANHWEKIAANAANETDDNKN